MNSSVAVTHQTDILIEPFRLVNQLVDFAGGSIL